MKKFLFLLATGVMLFSACGGNKEEEKKDTTPNPLEIKLQDVEEKYQDATSINDSLILLMSDIYAGLDAINTQEGLLMKPGIGDDANRREDIQKNLEIIKQRLASNRGLLADLQKKLEASGNENKVLAKTIEELKGRIDSQETKIAELNQQLQSANEQIVTLNEKIEEGEQINAALTQKVEETQAENSSLQSDLNRAYYVIGTKKQLKEWGVIEKKGNVMNSANVNYSKFIEVDKTQLASIPTNSKKVEIMSSVSPSSYEIVGEKNDPKTIRITDPTRFWQNSSYLVIEIK